MPRQYLSPVDYYENRGSYEAYTKMRITAEKDKKNAWLVISDRADNPVYEKPSLSSTPIGKIGFREAYYVTDEEEDWVELVDAVVDETKITNLRRRIGWVEKKKVLLWTSGLVGQSTRIHKKILLLNRAEDIANILKKEDKSKKHLYKGPDTQSEEPEKKIFEFYFILKKENNRFLLSEESNISPFTLDKIVGWVNARDCATWDTRICLEPNFSDEAFAERRDNPKFRLRAFEDAFASKEFANGGAESKVFWKDDPVIVKKEKMARSNPNRFNGYVIRFPMLNVSTDGSSFRSGIIGSIKTKKEGSGGLSFDSEIPEHGYSRMKNHVDELDRKTENVNIFFAIEATDSTFAFQQSIVDAMKNINSSDVTKGIPNLNYGALVFRDLPEEKVKLAGQTKNRLVDYVSLTRDFDKVVNFVKNQEFRNYQDKDDYTALYYGMSQALTQAGFQSRESELNIVLLIGCYGDYKIDRDRKAAAQRSRHASYFEEPSPIWESLSKINAHFYTVQLRNDGTKACNGFAKQGQVLMLEAAKYAYNKYYGNRTNPQTQQLLNKLSKDHAISVEEPTMADINEADDILLKGGRYPGRLFRPAVNRYLPPNQLSKILKDCVKESIDFENILKKIVNDVYVQGNALNLEELEGEYKFDGGRFTPALADMLNSILSDENISEKDLFNSLDEKYKLFTEVYIPQRMHGAKHPAISYVMYMPESDLLEYLKTIQRALITGSSFDKKREGLFSVYKELITQFSGETGLRNKKIEDFTRQEVMELMQGLSNSGLKLDFPLDIRIGDILEEKKVSNAEIDQLLLNFKKIEKVLDKAQRDAEEYDFCYPSEAGNRYYWIPLEDAF